MTQQLAGWGTSGLFRGIGPEVAHLNLIGAFQPFGVFLTPAATQKTISKVL
jgi:hypothetical protein